MILLLFYNFSCHIKIIKPDVTRTMGYRLCPNTNIGTDSIGTKVRCDMCNRNFMNIYIIKFNGVFKNFFFEKVCCLQKRWVSD